MAQDLVSKTERELCESFGRVIAQDLAIVRTALSAPDYRRHEGCMERPPTMSERDWNIINDAMLPAKDAPIYLKAAFEMAVVSQKIAGRLQTGDSPVAKVVIKVVEPRKYPVIDVTVEEEKKDG